MALSNTAAMSDVDGESETTTMAADTAARSSRHLWWLWCAFFCAMVVLGAVTPTLVFMLSPKTSYSVAIDSVSGMDPVSAAGTLNPEFNLTVRVASGSYRATGCINAGTYLEVSYRCVKLATSRTARVPVCAGPRRSAEQRVVARGTGVRLPGHLLDSLAEDLRQGAQVFDVTLKHSGSKGQDHWLASCDGGLVGWDADAALRTTCDDTNSYYYYRCFGATDTTLNSTQPIQQDGRSS